MDRSLPPRRIDGAVKEYRRGGGGGARAAGVTMSTVAVRADAVPDEPDRARIVETPYDPQGLPELALVRQVLLGHEPARAPSRRPPDAFCVCEVFPGWQVAVELVPGRVYDDGGDAQRGVGLEERGDEVLVLGDGHVGGQPGADPELDSVVFFPSVRLDLEVLVGPGRVVGGDVL